MSILLIEGIDGSGKTSVISHLVELMQDAGLNAKVMRDPGGTEAGEALRAICADASIPMQPMTQTLTFMAARAELTHYLNAGDWKRNFDYVILDRYWQSTVAYQSFGGGIDLDFILQAVEAIDNEYPDAVVPADNRYCLRIDPLVAHERRMSDPSRADERMKAANMDFKQRVADGYEWMCKYGYLMPIDVGDRTARSIAEEIFENCKQRG